MTRRADTHLEMPLLVARGVSKSFGPVAALVDVDFDVDAGEVVALVGDNGAGKSTLIKAIAGVQPADAGEIWIEGRRVPINSPADATRAGIATVYQDLALCDNLDVVGNLYLGAERIEPGVGRLLRTLDEDVMEVRTRELLRRLAVTTLTSPRSRVGSRSGGQRQAVAIARSLLTHPPGVDPRRADRCARRRADRAGARADPAAPRSRARGGHHQPQPRQHLPRRGPHRGAAPRTACRHLRPPHRRTGDAVAAITGGLVAPAMPPAEGVGV